MRLLREQNLLWASQTLALPPTSAAYGPIATARQQAARFLGDQNGRKLAQAISKRKRREGSSSTQSVELPESTSAAAALGEAARLHEANLPSAGMRPGARISKGLWDAGDPTLVNSQVVRSLDLPYKTDAKGLDEAKTIAELGLKVSSYKLRRGRMTRAQLLANQTLEENKRKRPFGKHAEEVKSDKLKSLTWSLMGRPSMVPTHRATERAKDALQHIQQTQKLRETQQQRQIILESGRAVDRSQPRWLSAANDRVGNIDLLQDAAYPSSSMPSRVTTEATQKHFFDPEMRGRVAFVGSTREGDTEHAPSAFEGTSDGEGVCCIEYCTPRPYTNTAKLWREERRREPSHILAVANGEMTLTFWDTKRFGYQGHVHMLEPTESMVWLPGANTLLTSHSDSQVIQVWDVLGKSLLAELCNHTQPVQAIVDIPAYGLFATGAMDCAVHLYSYSDEGTPCLPKLESSFRKHTQGIRSLATVGKEGLVLSGGGVDGYFLWDALAKVVLLNIPCGKSRFLDIKVLSGSHDDVAVTLDDSGLFRLWYLADFTAPAAMCIGLFRSKAPEFDIRVFDVISPGLAIVASGRAHHLLEHRVLQSVDPYPVRVEFSGQLGIIAVMTGTDFTLYNAETGMAMRTVHNATTDLIVGSSFDQSERKLILGDAAGNLLQFNAQTGSKLKEASESHTDDVVGVCYSGGDKVFVTGSWDRSLRVYDDSAPADFPCLRIAANAHECDITAVSYNRCCGKVVSGATDGSLRLWDFEELANEATAAGDGTAVTCSQFVTPQEALPVLVSGTDGGLLEFFHVPQAARGWRLQLSCDNSSSKAQSQQVHNIVGEPPRLPSHAAPTDTVSVPILALDTYVTGITTKRQAAARANEPVPRSSSRMFAGFQGSAEALSSCMDREFAEAYQGSRAAAWVVTGDGQGRIRCWDLTDAFLRWRVDPIPPTSQPQAKPSYDPRHKRRRKFQSTAQAAYDPSQDKMRLRMEQATGWGTELDDSAKRQAAPALKHQGKRPKSTLMKDRIRSDPLSFPQAIQQLSPDHPAWYSHTIGSQPAGFQPVVAAGLVGEQAWRVSRKDPMVRPQISWAAHTAPVLSVKFLPSMGSPTIISTSQDLSVRMWSFVGVPRAVLVDAAHSVPRGIDSSGLAPLTAAEVGWQYQPDLREQLKAREEEAQRLHKALHRPASRRASALGDPMTSVKAMSSKPMLQAVNEEQSIPQRPGLSLPSVMNAVGEAARQRSARAAASSAPQPTGGGAGMLAMPQATLAAEGSITLHMIDIDLDGDGLNAPGVEQPASTDFSTVDKVLQAANAKRHKVFETAKVEDAKAAKSDEAMLAGHGSRLALQDLERGSSASQIPLDQFVAFQVEKGQQQAENRRQAETRMLKTMRGHQDSSAAELVAAEHTMRDNAPMPKALVGKYANFSKHAVNQARKLRQQQRMMGGSEDAVREIRSKLTAMCRSRQASEPALQPRSDTLLASRRPQSAMQRSRKHHRQARPLSARTHAHSGRHAEAKPELLPGRRSSYCVPPKHSFEARFKAEELRAIEKRKAESEQVESRVCTLLRKSKAAFIQDKRVLQRGATIMDADVGSAELPANSVDDLSTLASVEDLRGGSVVQAVFPQEDARTLQKRRQRLVQDACDLQHEEDQETGPDRLATLLRTVQRRQSLPLSQLLYEEPTVKPAVQQSPLHASRLAAGRTRAAGREIPMWFGPYSRENVRSLKEMFDEIDIGKCMPGA